MKKVMISLVVVAGILLIGFGVITARAIMNKPTTVTAELKTQKTNLNTEFQQQLITRVEEELNEGSYQVAVGTSSEDVNTFMNLKDEGPYMNYKNCSGKVNFNNVAGKISYTLSTSCKKDKKGINLAYSVAKTELTNLESSRVVEVKDGYLVIGTIDSNNDPATYTANSVVIKYNKDFQQQFMFKISDETINNQNTTSFIKVSDIEQIDGYYYVLGYIQHAKGGDFTDLIAQVLKAYEEQKVDYNNSLDFSFLFKYDQDGNLVSKKLIDPVQGELVVNNILGTKDDKLYISGTSHLITYDLKKDTFAYKVYEQLAFEGKYMIDDNIYGYSRYCNLDLKKDEKIDNESSDAVQKITLKGKSVWKSKIDSTIEVKKNQCSDYIKEMYNLTDKSAIVHDQMNLLSFYDNDGKLLKTLNYEKFKEKKSDTLKIQTISKVKDNTVIALSNNRNLVVDTYDSNFKLATRFSVDYFASTNIMSNVYDIDHILAKENGFSQLKIMKGPTITLLKLDYKY